MFEKAKKAREYYRLGDYVKAGEMFSAFVAEYPQFSKLYSANIELCQKHIENGDQISVDSVAYKQRSNGSPLSVDDLISEVYEEAKDIPSYVHKGAPLVSVIMTCHNSERYIEESITSVLRQSWRKLELIVVDDYSSDATETIVRRLWEIDKRIVYRRLNSNLGTNFAKNSGIKIAKGEYIFFQDSDDLSHPERLRISMRPFLVLDAEVVRGYTVTVSFPSGKVLPVNGEVARPGCITLGVKRSIFEEIGYFNCTTKASDDEFICRLDVYLASKNKAVVNIQSPYYYATFRDDSLSSDMVLNNPESDGVIKRANSQPRALYREQFEKLHSSLALEDYSNFYRFPVIRDLIQVEPEMTKLANPTCPVIASLCSIPERQELLKVVLESLAPQVDKIYLYLDRYEEVPEFVSKLGTEVTVFSSDVHPGLRDNGKFLALSELSGEFYYFTADDDIEYPADYVNSMLKKLNEYDNKVVVGVHGVIVGDHSESYFDGRRKVFRFDKRQEKDVFVNNLGTGTTAFHSRLVPDLNVDFFERSGMADLYLSLFCKKMNVPMVCVQRPDDWLIELSPDNPTSLFHEFRRDDSAQARIIRNNRPWGVKAIEEALSSALKDIADPATSSKMEQMLPILNRYMQ